MIISYLMMVLCVVLGLSLIRSKQRRFQSAIEYDPKDFIKLTIPGGYLVDQFNEQEKDIIEQFKGQEKSFLEGISRQKKISDMRRTYVDRDFEYQEIMCDGISGQKIYLSKKKCVRVRRKKGEL